MDPVGRDDEIGFEHDLPARFVDEPRDLGSAAAGVLHLGEPQSLSDRAGAEGNNDAYSCSRSSAVWTVDGSTASTSAGR